MSNTLPPHLWDDDAHRLTIHTAADRYWQALACGNVHDTSRKLMELERLIADAEVRRFIKECYSGAKPVCPESAIA